MYGQIGIEKVKTFKSSNKIETLKLLEFLSLEDSILVPGTKLSACVSATYQKYPGFMFQPSNYHGNKFIYYISD